MMAYHIFQIGQQRYAIDSHDILGMMPLSPLSFLPYSHSAVLGLTVWQGQVIPVLDLLLFWTIPTKEANHQQILIVKNKEKKGARAGLFGIAVTKALVIDRLSEQNITAISGNHVKRTGVIGSVMTQEARVTVLAAEIFAKTIQYTV